MNNKKISNDMVWLQLEDNAWGCIMDLIKYAKGFANYKDYEKFRNDIINPILNYIRMLEKKAGRDNDK